MVNTVPQVRKNKIDLSALGAVDLDEVYDGGADLEKQYLELTLPQGTEPDIKTVTIVLAAVFGNVFQEIDEQSVIFECIKPGLMRIKYRAYFYGCVPYTAIKVQLGNQSRALKRKTVGDSGVYLNQMATYDVSLHYKYREQGRSYLSKVRLSVVECESRFSLATGKFTEKTRELDNVVFLQENNEPAFHAHKTLKTCMDSNILLVEYAGGRETPYFVTKDKLEQAAILARLNDYLLSD